MWYGNKLRQQKIVWLQYLGSIAMQQIVVIFINSTTTMVVIVCIAMLLSIA
jgi:hypothetical protein